MSLRLLEKLHEVEVWVEAVAMMPTSLYIEFESMYCLYIISIGQVQN